MQWLNKNIFQKNLLQILKKKAKFEIEKINKLEKDIKHDVVAFLTNVSNNIGDDGRFLHQGMTSSDILDTTLSIQLSQSSDIIINDIEKILEKLKIKCFEHKYTPIMGRSHGVHAELTTFGIKLSGFYSEFKRNLNRIKNAKILRVVSLIIGLTTGLFAEDSCGSFLSEFFFIRLLAK